MKRCTVALLLLGILFATAPATEAADEETSGLFEWTFTGELNLAPRLTETLWNGDPRVYDVLNTTLDYSYAFFHLTGGMSLINDEKYEPLEDYVLGRYFYLNNGGVIFDFDFLSFQAGRFVHNDIVDSPYSLFVSAYDEHPGRWTPGLPALLLDLEFQAGPFSYESRWFRLNARSLYGYPDRGANYKVFALRFGDLRFGLQDSAVYVDRIFDEEYFLNPLPNIIIQMAAKMDKNPWAENTNDNTITGLFVEWDRSLSYLYAQWLVDDLSLDFLIPDSLRDELGDRKIASKMAWSLGGYYDFSFGRLGFYHAGATKFTFEGYSDEYPYSYTYYPASTYDRDGTDMTLDYLDNYIGYKYGENNLAFLLDYQTELHGVGLGGSLEYVISGSKSPANPWHEYTTASAAGKYTQMLDDPVLEHMVSARINAAWRWRCFTLYTRLRLGGVFNKLELVDPGDGGEDIFRPQAGVDELIYRWTLGVTYHFRAGKKD